MFDRIRDLQTAEKIGSALRATPDVATSTMECVAQATGDITPSAPDGSTASGRPQSPYDDKSLMGLGVGLVAALAAGSLCSLAKLPEAATGSVTAISVAFPAALDLHIKSRRRDKNVDAARIHNGELRRPAGLIVALLTASVLLLDTAIGGIAGAYMDLMSRDSTSEATALTLSPLVTMIAPAAVGVCVFLAAGHASHFLGNRPYTLVAAAIGCCLAVRVLVLSLFWDSAMADVMVGMSLFDFVWMTAVLHTGYFAIALAGAWLGRRHHDEFLVRKLAKIERSRSIAEPVLQES